MARRWPRLEVTDADIAAARPNDRARSPLMLAARRQFPDADVDVGSYGLGFTHHCEQCCCASTYGLSRRARQFLERFNSGRAVEPAAFEFRGPTVQALLAFCSCDAWKAARRRDAERAVEFRRIVDVVGEIRKPYQQLVDEPARTQLRDAFPDLHLADADQAASK